MKKITAKTTKVKKSTPPAARAPVAAPAPVAVSLKIAGKAPAKKPAVKTTSTKIVAQIDVGFGNTLYLRGEGPGLTWDKGLVMDCVGDNEWTITVSDAAKPVVFKFLLNDTTWCVGDDYLVDPGTTTTIVPVF
jgi:hypothetical protein